MTGTTAYCTILSTNYLPKALALAESLRRHQDGASLTVLIIDARSDAELPEVPGVDLVGTDVLGLPERELLEVATIYDLVEFATAVKPLLLKHLLGTDDAVFYLDPDTYLTSPMAELEAELAASEGGILLTPHFLEPLPQDAPTTEGHLLTVGVFNLGFCGVDRRALDMLEWWWAHLRRECLFDFLSGLFVDQKWMDIGNTLFRARSLRHYGYNVSVVNLHERPIVERDGRLTIATTGEPLRLFHFHAFDTDHPEELSTRHDGSTAHLRTESAALDVLCREYAEILLAQQARLDPAPPYAYAHDTRGRRISRQLRRAYRAECAEDSSLPSPFLAEEADEFEAWRRRAWKPEAREVVGDALKSLRMSLPEEYARIKGTFPGLASRLRGRYVRADGIWG
ncbi:MAG TPA: hypothetical protein VHO29_18945 [Marmoricola sp.]|nr:hypothetical protein [Marmoricola sp.]